MAIQIHFNGYAETILKFVEEYLEVLRGCAKHGGFEREVIDNVIDDVISEFEDANCDQLDHAANNRICYLHATTFHPSLIANAIKEIRDS